MLATAALLRPYSDELTVASCLSTLSSAVSSPILFSVFATSSASRVVALELGGGRAVENPAPERARGIV